jgi:hypothetical protein
MKTYGLPTYPIADGMILRRRPLEEYQWLIERGIFTHWKDKWLITRQNGRYQLYRNHVPIPELEADAPTLDALIKDHDLPIRQFQWHQNWQNEEEEV